MYIWIRLRVINIRMMISYEIIKNQPSYVRIHASLLFTFVLPKVSSRVYKKAYKKHYKSYVRKQYLNYLFYAVRIEALTYEGT